jgi:hypothetical protein
MGQLQRQVRDKEEKSVSIYWRASFSTQYPSNPYAPPYPIILCLNHFQLNLLFHFFNNVRRCPFKDIRDSRLPLPFLGGLWMVRIPEEDRQTRQTDTGSSVVTFENENTQT